MADDVEDAAQAVLVQRGRHILQGQVGGGQRHPEGLGSLPRFSKSRRHRAGQHHHHLVGIGALGEILGMAGKRHAGIVDRAFLQRCGDHGFEPAGVDAFDGGVQRGQHGAAVVAVQYARHHVGTERHVDHADPFRSEMRQAAIAHRHQRQRRDTDGGIDGGSGHGQESSVAEQHAVDVVPPRPRGAQRDFGTDAGRFAHRHGNRRTGAPWLDRGRQAGVRSMRGVRMCAHGCSSFSDYFGGVAMVPSSLRNSTKARSRTSRCQLSVASSSF